MQHFLLMIAALITTVPIQGAPLAGRTTWTDLQYLNVARQGLEPSCAAASVVTILNAQFGEALAEFHVWSTYVADLNATERQLASDMGLSIADVVNLVDRPGYRAYPVRIDLLELNSIGRPVVIYIERGGAQPFRHFAVFDGLDGVWVRLRDPSLGNRRVRIETFLRQWRGHAVFIDRR
jgi:predicted double-glycine peptidase